VSGRQGRELGEALAYLFGDYRDEPLRCPWDGCGSERVDHDPIEDAYRCRECRRLTSGEVMGDDRERRMRARVRGGVGGPLVDLVESRRP
jgi:hypothetical protein